MQATKNTVSIPLKLVIADVRGSDNKVSWGPAAENSLFIGSSNEREEWGDEERGDKERDVGLLVRGEDKSKTELDFWPIKLFFPVIFLSIVGWEIEFITMDFW